MNFQRFLIFLVAAHLCTVAHGATLTVTTLDDTVDGNGGQCALREAIDNTNNNAQTHMDCVAGDGIDDTILFAGTLFDGNDEASIVLGGLELFIDDADDGLTIDAGPDRRLTITTQSVQRLVRVSEINRFEMRNITLRGGSDGFGGALSLFASDVVLDGVHFIDNSVDVSNQPAAGLYLSTRSDADTLTLRNCLFQNNDSPRAAGAVFALLNHALTFTIEDCVFRQNDATSGGAIYANASNNALDGIATLTIRRSVFSSNSATSGGGAITIGATSEVVGFEITVEESSFKANTTEYLGAAMHLDNGSGASVFKATISQATFSDNDGARTTLNAARGGAIAAADIDLTISNSLFHRNTSDFRGGGAYIDYSNSVLARSMSLIGNSFIDHDLNNAGADGRALFVELPQSASVLTTTARGNLFRSASTPTAGSGSPRSRRRT